MQLVNRKDENEEIPILGIGSRLCVICVAVFNAISIGSLVSVIIVFSEHERLDSTIT